MLEREVLDGAGVGAHHDAVSVAALGTEPGVALAARRPHEAKGLPRRVDEHRRDGVAPIEDANLVVEHEHVQRAERRGLTTGPAPEEEVAPEAHVRGGAVEEQVVVGEAVRQAPVTRALANGVRGAPAARTAAPDVIGRRAIQSGGVVAEPCAGISHAAPPSSSGRQPAQYAPAHGIEQITPHDGQGWPAAGNCAGPSCWIRSGGPPRRTCVTEPTRPVYRGAWGGGRGGAPPRRGRARPRP